MYFKDFKIDLFLISIKLLHIQIPSTSVSYEDEELESIIRELIDLF